MAKQSTKPSIKSSEEEYLQYREMLKMIEYENILNLLLNSVKIEKLPDYVPEPIIKRWLFELGGIANYQLTADTELFTKFVGAGVDEYGRPTMFTLITEDGRTFTVKKDSEFLKGLLYIKPDFTGIKNYLWQRCEELAYIRMCMQNNLVATENQVVYECPDVDTVNKMKIAYKKREIGMPVIFTGETNKTYTDGVNVLGKDVPFVADKLLAMYTNVRNEILEHFGILAGNTDKKERVQSMEINSQVGYVIDNIYMFIETFNYYCEINNLEIRMKLNSTVENLYAEYKNGDESNDTNNDNNI